MGRELKRVPMDFDAPLNEVWSGYISPDWRKCPANCENGVTPARAWIHSVVYLLTMLDGEVGKPVSGMHPWLQAVGLTPSQSPSADIVEFGTGLCGREGRQWGHDAVDAWRAEEAVIKAAGLSKDWGICPVCKGETIHPDDIEAREAWTPTEPPTGDGFQLWETTSEGSPISPVFTMLDELCAWAENGATTFGNAKTSAAEWKRMLDDGLVIHQVGGAIFL